MPTWNVKISAKGIKARSLLRADCHARERDGSDRPILANQKGGTVAAAVIAGGIQGGEVIAMSRFNRLVAGTGEAVSVVHAARTAVAAIVSLQLASLFRLPEAYWAPISTIIVMQSTLGAALPISAQRLIGTAIGAVAGAATATYFGRNPWVFGPAIFVLGGLARYLLDDSGAGVRSLSGSTCQRHHDYH